MVEIDKCWHVAHYTSNHQDPEEYPGKGFGDELEQDNGWETEFGEYLDGYAVRLSPGMWLHKGDKRGRTFLQGMLIF